MGLRDHGFVKRMIVITHDLAVLYQIADTILVMYAGKLAEKAPTEVIIEAPRHPYTRLLICVAARRWACAIEDRRLEGIPGRPPSLLDPPAGLPLPGALPARADEQCLEEPPFVEIEPGH